MSVGLVHDRIEEDDAAAGREDTLQLGQRGGRVGQQVERVAADDEGERAVLVRQRVQVDQGERHVDEAELGGEALALLEHVGQLVGGLYRAPRPGATANPAMPAPAA